jgi:LacI family transcriptional regulator
MVAQQAGVSVPTVSKVLNGRHEVGSDTRRRVEDALKATGYRRRMRSNGAGRIGLVDFVITELDTSWGVELLRGAEQEAYRLGASLVLTLSHDRQARPRDWLRMIASRPTDGVVLVVTNLRQVAAERTRLVDTPFVVIDQLGGYDPDTPTVGATNWAGGFAATQHLTALGHRRIGIITGPVHVRSSDERLDGYRAALGRAGLAADESLIREGDFYAEGGRRGAAALLDLPEPPTAVFAGSDQQARGVYDEAHARGLRIPEDLSVVGFDDVDACEWMTPRLTTVRQPLAQMAALAIRTVLEPSPQEDERPLRVELATSLVVRESTTTPPRGPAAPKRKAGRKP